MATNPPSSVIARLFHFPRGCPQPFNIKDSIGSLGDPNAAARLSALQELRSTLEKLWGQDLNKTIIPRTETHKAASAPEILGCIDSYWPALLQLILSVEADPEAVRPCEQFVVEWPSPLTRVAIKVKLNKVANAEHVKGALYLEASMLLFSRAMMLYDESRLTLGVTCSGDVKVAAEKLRAAAGVLDYLVGRIENEWATNLCSLVTLEQRPLETTPPCCNSLRDVFLAQAQGLAVAQALKANTQQQQQQPNGGGSGSGRSGGGGGGYKPSVLCKLSRGVVVLLQGAIAHLKASVPKAEELVTGVAAKADEHGNLFDYLGLLVHAWTACSHRFMAEELWQKDKYGQAVAHQQACVEAVRLACRGGSGGGGLEKNKKSSSSGGGGSGSGGLLGGQLAVLGGDLARWQAAEEATLESWSHDNSSIYYDVIPSSVNDRDSLPLHHIMMKPTPMPHPENVVPISLHREGDHPAAAAAAADAAAVAAEVVAAAAAAGITQADIDEGSDSGGGGGGGVVSGASGGVGAAGGGDLPPPSYTEVAHSPPPPPPSYDDSVAPHSSPKQQQQQPQPQSAATGNFEQHRRLEEMGFSASKVSSALAKHKGDEAAALEELLTGL
jgi:uncharacterized membrane protein YgcG